jgi:putative cell wall-binding protein
MFWNILKHRSNFKKKSVLYGRLFFGQLMKQLKNSKIMLILTHKSRQIQNYLKKLKWLCVKGCPKVVPNKLLKYHFSIKNGVP